MLQMVRVKDNSVCPFFLSITPAHDHLTCAKWPLRMHLRNKLIIQPETSTDLTGRIPRFHALILLVINLIPSRSPGPCSESLFIKIKIK